MRRRRLQSQSLQQINCRLHNGCEEPKRVIVKYLDTSTVERPQSPLELYSITKSKLPIAYSTPLALFHHHALYIIHDVFVCIHMIRVCDLDPGDFCFGDWFGTSLRSITLPLPI